MKHAVIGPVGEGMTQPQNNVTGGDGPQPGIHSMYFYTRIICVWTRYWILESSGLQMDALGCPTRSWFEWPSNIYHSVGGSHCKSLQVSSQFYFLPHSPSLAHIIIIIFSNNSLHTVLGAQFMHCSVMPFVLLDLMVYDGGCTMCRVMTVSLHVTISQRPVNCSGDNSLAYTGN